MAKRRANTEGNVYQRGDGRWEGRLSYLDSATGERKRVSVYAATKKLALAELDKVKDRLAEDKPVKDATATVAAWLAQWRSTTLAASDRKSATVELYSNLSRKHLEPAPFGVLRLDRLNRPGNPGGSDVPRVWRCRYTWFQATGWADWCSSSNSIGVRIPSAE
jgi:hypothetical protein